MSESKKICKSPNCNKEVHEEGALFCLDHERTLDSGKEAIKSVAINSAKVALGLGVTLLGKMFLDNNKKG